MSIQLNTVEEILTSVQAYSDDNRGTDIVVRFVASGRYVSINPMTNGLRARAQRWLARYIVTREESGYLMLHTLPLGEFNFLPGRRSRGELRGQITSAENRIQTWQREADRYRRDLTALDNPQVAGPVLSDLQEFAVEWPELISIDTDHSNPNWNIVTRFIPVLFTNSQECVAISGNLNITVDRDGSWRSTGLPSVHPHINRSGRILCRGNIQNLFIATVKANQVYAALEIVRRWRVGYDPQGVYNEEWVQQGWEWLQSVRGGSIVTDWDGLYVQQSRSGEVILLEEALSGQVDQYIHVGLNQGWVSEQNVLQEDGTTECVGCKGAVRSCPCHGGYCAGCQRLDTWCICPESRYVLSRESGQITAVLHPGEYAGTCGECSGEGPNVIYEQPINRLPVTGCPARIYCALCRPDPRATELRAAIERETNDSTHDESTTDDGASSTEGA